jgi:glycosyltransferase involved in cell wall biosynthesis
MSTTIALHIDSDVVAGAERAVLHVLAHYSGSAELVLCATSDVVLERAAEVAPGVRQVLIPRNDSFAASVLAHRRAFREVGPDLLHITLANPFAARSAVIAGLTLGLPTVTVEQLVLPGRRRRGRWLKRTLSAPLAGQVAVGEASARDLERWFGIPRRATRVIYNGIPDEPIQPIELGSTGGDGRRRVVGCAARLEDQKQLEVLIDAMADVADAQLLLVGDGSRRADLATRAERLGLDARFVGWVPDARPWIAAFDVFALPSRAEAFPLTIVEAMLSGTPIVASAVGSVPEAVRHEETGLLVPSGDRAALTAAIRRILDDGPLRERLVVNAGQLARERFTAAQMAAGYDALWQQVLSRPPRWCRIAATVRRWLRSRTTWIRR